MENRRANHTTYPLSAMFILMAACAMVAALVGPVVQAVAAGDLGLVEVLVASVTGSVATMVLGGVLGLYHHRPWRGLAWGLLVGGVIGALIGPLVLAPAEAFASLLITAVSGAVVLLLVGTYLYRSTARPR